MEKRGFLTGIGVKRILWRGLTALVLVLSFRTFQFFPGILYVQEAWFALCFLIVLFVYPFWMLRSGLRISRFEVYLLVLAFASAALASLRAYQVFGQPIIYGILSQRGIVLVAGWLILLNMLRSGVVEVADLEASLLCLAWSTFTLYSAMLLLLSPANFAEYGDGFVTNSTVGAEASFKLQGAFIIFGVFYYAIQGIRTGQMRNYLAAAILFPVTMGASGRGLIVSVAATLLFVLYRIRGIRRTLITTAKFLTVTAVFAGVIFSVFPSAVSKRIGGFSDAFTAVLTGSTTQDSSANARILEVWAALPYIQEHPLLGNGVVSQQWNGGSQTAMGEYFFASDIGIVGIVFSYGILGLLLYLWQYRFAFRASKELSASFHTPLVDATKAFLLYSALYSVETGTCVWSADITIFFVTVMCGLAAQQLVVDSSYRSIGRESGLQIPAQLA
jgi:O-antigen ligase